MSENLNRSNPDFSKYDIMSIGELEEILRADAQGPERDDSDVDEILYVMEVLAKKRRQNGIAGKTALEAYQEFQQHYRPIGEERSMPKHKSNIIPFRRIAAIAACLVLVFSFATSANAFCFRDVWNSVVTWAQETFSFSMGVEVSEPNTEDNNPYPSLADALCELNINVALPNWLPDDFMLNDIIIDTTPQKEVILAVYQNGNKNMKISITTFFTNGPEQVETNGQLVELIMHSGIEYYIMNNNNMTLAVWMVDNYECYISGDLSYDELKQMITSIEKG